jgi:four helix bundle protein
MPTDKELEKYKRPDGTIDWGKYALERLLSEEPKTKKKEKLENLSLFKIADELSDYIWNLVSRWDSFSKKTLGDQIVRSADSIGANICEGYGRFFFGDYLIFLYYARGSTYETNYWAQKAFKRKLITNEEYKFIKERLDKLPIEINKVAKIVKTQAQKWKGKPIH